MGKMKTTEMRDSRIARSGQYLFGPAVRGAEMTEVDTDDMVQFMTTTEHGLTYPREYPGKYFIDELLVKTFDEYLARNPEQLKPGRRFYFYELTADGYRLVHTGTMMPSKYLPMPMVTIPGRGSLLTSAGLGDASGTAPPGVAAGGGIAGVHNGRLPVFQGAPTGSYLPIAGATTGSTQPDVAAMSGPINGSSLPSHGVSMPMAMVARPEMVVRPDEQRPAPRVSLEAIIEQMREEMHTIRADASRLMERLSEMQTKVIEADAKRLAAESELSLTRDRHTQEVASIKADHERTLDTLRQLHAKDMEILQSKAIEEAQRLLREEAPLADPDEGKTFERLMDMVAPFIQPATEIAREWVQDRIRQRRVQHGMPNHSHGQPHGQPGAQPSYDHRGGAAYPNTYEPAYPNGSGPAYPGNNTSWQGQPSDVSGSEGRSPYGPASGGQGGVGEPMIVRDPMQLFHGG